MKFKAGNVEKLSTQVSIGRKDDLGGGAPLPEDLRQDLDPDVSETATVEVVIQGKRWKVETDDESEVLIVAGTEQLHFYKVDLGQSLAGAIESAFDQAWKDVKQEEPPMSGKEDRRILYVAVARGVLGYLGDHQEVFSVSVEAEQKEHPRVVSSGTTEESDVTGSASHTHDVEIAQKDGNTIVCSDDDGDVKLEVKDINNG